MTLFDPATLTQFRRTQEASMMHECTIEPYVVGEDGTITYGKAVEHVPCGFKLASRVGSENAGELYDTVSVNAELRLPIGTAIGLKDRVTITGSFGQAVTSALFEVCHLPDTFGPSGYVVGLSEVYS